MARIVLRRFLEAKGVTLGQLFVDGISHRDIYILEPPWLDNRENISRIPAGVYRLVPHGWNGEAVQYEKTWRVEGVAGRTAILIHWGNWLRNTNGCQLAGLGLKVDAEAMVTSSVAAIDALREHLGGREEHEYIVLDIGHV